jgi:uncharacterized protein YjiS (DUF1127 family)
MFTDISSAAGAVRRPRPRLLRLLSGLTGVARSRRRLTELDDRMLRDIGVSRAEADREADRAAWDVPRGWRL